MPPFFFIYIFLYFVFFLLFCCLLIKRSSRKRSSSRWRSRASAAAPLREPSDLIEVAASFSHSCRHCFIIHAHITQRTLCMHSLYVCTHPRPRTRFHFQTAPSKSYPYSSGDPFVSLYPNLNRITAAFHELSKLFCVTYLSTFYYFQTLNF